MPKEYLTAQELETLRKEALRHLWVHVSPAESLEAPGGIRVISRADGNQLIDVEGNTFYDPMGGLELVNVGYGRTEIAKAVYEQLSQIHYADPFRNQTVPQIKLASKLASLMPGSLNKVFFVTSGSEANEAALKVVWQYHEMRGFPHKKKIIARRNSYHGSTLGTVAMVGPSITSFAYSSSVEPLPSWAKQVPPPNPLRCDYCTESTGCRLQCATEIERLIEFERPETVGAVVLDAISAQHGVPPPGYIDAVRDICKKHNVLLWFDEVITGFGRTGKWFAAEHWNVEPDIMTVSKGITSGYMPLGAMVVTEAISSTFRGGPERSFKHGHTWGGHPAACAAGIANLDIIERENLVENAHQIGRYFIDQLGILKEHSIVSSVSGIGLMAVVDLVENKTSQKPLARGNPILTSLITKMREYGLLGSPYLLTPPLNVTKTDIDEMVSRLDSAFGDLAQDS